MGLGCCATILRQNGIETDIVSTRAVTSWEQLARKLPGYKMALMNVRSYTFPVALKAAKIFKEINPGGLVLAGGMHATVAPQEMEAEEAFDRICQGAGEEIIVDLVRDPHRFPRVLHGKGSRSMAEWPAIDRELWPKPANWKDALANLRPRRAVRSLKLERRFNWPMEPECGWGPPPVATIITSRVCPWQCVFCNEASYIPNMGAPSGRHDH